MPPGCLTGTGTGTGTGFRLGAWLERWGECWAWRRATAEPPRQRPEGRRSGFEPYPEGTTRCCRGHAGDRSTGINRRCAGAHCRPSSLRCVARSECRRLQCESRRKRRESRDGCPSDGPRTGCQPEQRRPSASTLSTARPRTTAGTTAARSCWFGVAAPLARVREAQSCHSLMIR